jgi:hypothetical protein
MLLRGELELVVADRLVPPCEDGEEWRPIVGYEGFYSSISQLVLIAFKGGPPGEIGQYDHQHSCNHINGDPMDNRRENLEWLLNPEHRRHTVRNRLHAHHETHPRAKLKWSQVEEIRERHAAGESGRKLAREFKVSPTAVYQIINRCTWVLQ